MRIKNRQSVRCFILILAVFIILGQMNPAGADPEAEEQILKQTDEERNKESIPDYLKEADKPRESPVGIAVRDLSTDGEKTEETVVRMLPGQSGELRNSKKEVFLKWALDEEGYFTISFERPGNYTFRFLLPDTGNENATFGGILIGGGGGGGGATTEPADAVGSGGSGGDVILYKWREFETGWNISDFLTPRNVVVGEGGKAGAKFYFCTCGGERCPIGSKADTPAAKTNNDGANGGDTVFGGITASGGLAGIGGAKTGGRDSGVIAADGRNGSNAGAYVFWGVEYQCGYGGGGGAFGLNDGEGGDPIYFHDPGTVSFGHTGCSAGGRGNGGGGGGMSYSFGHPMISGQGTGQGGGSYSHTVEGTVAKGGNSPSYNGYIYLQGRVHITDRETGGYLDRFQLIATVYPTEINPVPKVVWETSNVKTAKVSAAGVVTVYDNEEVTVTATAEKYGVQGVYQINRGLSPVSVKPSEELRKIGDTAVMTAEIQNSNAQEYVFWDTTNSAVAEIDPRSGNIKIVGKGIAVITATLANGDQGSYILDVA